MKKISKKFPRLLSERLHLRPFTLEDGPEVNRLVGHESVASTLVAVKYPYTEDMARQWISNHAPAYNSNGALNFAVEERESRVLIGFIGIGGDGTQAGMGYWYGRSFWKRGYATEAGRLTIALGFEELGLEQIEASHLKENLASGRALQKMGMLHQGQQWHYVPKWDAHHEKEEYAITRNRYWGLRDDKPELYRYKLI